MWTKVVVVAVVNRTASPYDFHSSYLLMGKVFSVLLTALNCSYAVSISLYNSLKTSL